MKLPFFGAWFVDRLRGQASANVQRYGLGTAWLDDVGQSRMFRHDSRHVVDPPPALLTSEDDNPKNDAENAKRVYRWLREIPPTTAMEERLWSCLTHSIFPEYMAIRWPVEDEATIHRRYLFEGKTFAALTRNGIARLWWAGYLTHDSKREAPFELTEVLLSRQDLHVSLLERALGKSEVVRRTVLEFVRDNRAWLSDEAFGKRIQVLLRELNLLGGVAVLDTLQPHAIRSYLEGVSSSWTQDRDLE